MPSARDGKETVIPTISRERESPQAQAQDARWTWMGLMTAGFSPHFRWCLDGGSGKNAICSRKNDTFEIFSLEGSATDEAAVDILLPEQ